MTKAVKRMDQDSIDQLHSEQIVKDLVTVFKELLENSLDAKA
jgi:DNA mismatch repair ATPase MutL